MTIDLIKNVFMEMLAKNDPQFKEKLDNSSIKNISVKEIGEKNGLMSYVFRVLIKFENGEEHSFVMKKPTLDQIHGIVFENVEMNKKLYPKTIDIQKELHNKECDAYKLIRSVKNFPIPKIYYLEKSDNKNPGVIIMEDFFGKATTIGLFQSPTQQHCLNIAKFLGDFQAQMNKNNKEWKGKFSSIDDITNFMSETFLKTLKYLGETRTEFEKYAKLLQNFDVIQFLHYSLKDLPEELGATTFCHGDLWSNNMLMKISNDGSVLNEFAAIIDWQLVFEGNTYNDLTRFLIKSFDTDIRRSSEKEAVNLQYDTFCKVSKKLGLEIKFTREEAHKLYEYALIAQTFTLVPIIPIVKSSNLENVSEKVLDAQLEKLFLRCRLALDDSLDYMEKYGVVGKFDLNE